MEPEPEPPADEQLIEPVEDTEPMEGTTPTITELRPADVIQDKPENDEYMVGELTWTVENMGRTLGSKAYSENFDAGGYLWNILIYPQGKDSKAQPQLALYLNAAETKTLPLGWQRKAVFQLMVVNQKDPAASVMRDTEHTFDAGACDWGFTQFLGLRDLHDPQKGFMVGDAFKVKALVKVEKVDSLLYNSKEATGCVGLKNQGATCYMNSLLQTLFHLHSFRKAVYHMPTEDEASATSIALALQSLFYKLQFGEGSVSTKDLTKSFGWDSIDAFMQHDVQELNRVLAEKLEEKMKGTKVDGTIPRLFEGRLSNYMNCINVEYKSTREDTFMDLQLDVKGCRDIHDSFDKYCEVERLEGANQYAADGHGLQDAEKGVKFKALPPILQLQLKRFEYDFDRNMTVKINDGYKFFDVLDLDRNGRAYMSEDSDSSVHNKYKLHSVLVHSGNVHSGHYYSFSCVHGNQWLKFDDEKVTKQSARCAIDDQFGGEDEGGLTPSHGLNIPSIRHTKYSNAYMLVYVREDDWSNVMCEVQESEIAAHVRERLAKDKEEKERRRKEKQEAHLYATIRVATDESLRQQIGDHITFDLVDFEKVEYSLKVLKTATIAEFRDQFAAEYKVPPEQQRWWRWTQRTNHTHRPCNPLTARDDLEPITKINELQGRTTNVYNPLPMVINLYLEQIEAGAPELEDKQTLLFLKFLDDSNRDAPKLQYKGHFYAPTAAQVSSALTLIRAKCQLPPDTPLIVNEEIKSEPSVMCDVVDVDATFQAAALEDGDILVVQEEREAEGDEPQQSALEYFERERNKLSVTFRHIDKAKTEEGQICVQLSRLSTYAEITAVLARELGVSDPDTIRLTGHSNYSMAPAHAAFRYGQEKLLSNPTAVAQGFSEILFYEVLDMQLPVMERLQELRVVWHNERGEAVSEHTVMVPKDGEVENLCEVLRQKLDLAEGERIRVMNVQHTRVHTLYNLDAPVREMGTAYQLRAELMPEEDEIATNEQAAHMLVCHFHRSAPPASWVTEYGDPIIVKVGAEEEVGTIRERILQRLGVPLEEAQGWKLALLAHNSPAYMSDDRKIYDAYNGVGIRRHSELFGVPIGLEHPDTRKRRPPVANRFHMAYEKPITIRN
ncbi:hypothetical protein WJX73_006228 [Symbiochloris irregularis]|uniref:ubiquitinyl hydrolase 1 n=1 Tax=Symbiochloris irregularis TaxID=706552 RepID=A0AAW1PZ79_9CHLO